MEGADVCLNSIGIVLRGQCYLVCVQAWHSSSLVGDGVIAAWRWILHR